MKTPPPTPPTPTPEQLQQQVAEFDSVIRIPGVTPHISMDVASGPDMSLGITTINARLIARAHGEKIELYGLLLNVAPEAIALLGADDNLIDCEIIIRPRRRFAPFLPAPGCTVFTMVSKYNALSNLDAWGKPSTL